MNLGNEVHMMPRAFSVDQLSSLNPFENKIKRRNTDDILDLKKFDHFFFLSNFTLKFIKAKISHRISFLFKKSNQSKTRV